LCWCVRGLCAPVHVAVQSSASIPFFDSSPTTTSRRQPGELVPPRFRCLQDCLRTGRRRIPPCVRSWMVVWCVVCGVWCVMGCVCWQCFFPWGDVRGSHTFLAARAGLVVVCYPPHPHSADVVCYPPAPAQC
jgi:hypothetical protein